VEQLGLAARRRLNRLASALGHIPAGRLEQDEREKEDTDDRLPMTDD
jgi:hypothetical protein